MRKGLPRLRRRNLLRPLKCNLRRRNLQLRSKGKVLCQRPFAGVAAVAAADVAAGVHKARRLSPPTLGPASLPSLSRVESSRSKHPLRYPRVLPRER